MTRQDWRKLDRLTELIYLNVGPFNREQARELALGIMRAFRL